MALLVKSFVFEDPVFHDTPTVENEEVSMEFLDQIRSPMQNKIAVIMKSTTAPVKTRVKVIRNDGTEQYEVDVERNPIHWAVNDYGEVLLYGSYESDGSTVYELILLAATGDIKWAVDVTGIPNVHGVALGTDHAILFYHPTEPNRGMAKFYSTANGSLEATVDFGIVGDMRGRYFCSYDGYWGVCYYGGNTTFVSKDGDVIRHKCGDRVSQPHSADASASVVGITKGCLIFRTGETVEIGSEDDRVWVAPSGDCAMLIREQKIELYSIWPGGYALLTETPFADGQSGCIEADISYYGKYALVLHNTNDVCVYDLKNTTFKDKLHNELASRPVIVCAD